MTDMGWERERGDVATLIGFVSLFTMTVWRAIGLYRFWYQNSYETGLVELCSRRVPVAPTGIHCDVVSLMPRTYTRAWLEKPV